MSQPSLTILSLALKMRDQFHTRSYTMKHVLAYAHSMGYPRDQAKLIVINVYQLNDKRWRTWG